jgi:hypothetical protein
MNAKKIALLLVSLSIGNVLSLPAEAQSEVHP